jgi:hypothetical protein
MRLRDEVIAISSTVKPQQPHIRLTDGIETTAGGLEQRSGG